MSDEARPTPPPNEATASGKEKTGTQLVVDQIRSSPYKKDSLNVDALIDQAKFADMGVKDYRNADGTVTIYDTGKNAYTIRDGRLHKEQTVELRQRFDGEPANYAHYWTTELDPDSGEVARVTHKSYYLPQKGGEILNAIHTQEPTPDQPGTFYHSAYTQVDHFKGVLEPTVNYPPPKVPPPPSAVPLP